ncbi:hypothetical protein FACS189452_07670 [Bacteroidia bacterium]|nr:hypothetical protein FACS189452_07670 [Bacteroidia bacterium]
MDLNNIIITILDKYIKSRPQNVDITDEEIHVWDLNHFVHFKYTENHYIFA